MRHRCSSKPLETLLSNPDSPNLQGEFEKFYPVHPAFHGYQPQRHLSGVESFCTRRNKVLMIKPSQSVNHNGLVYL